MPDNEVGDRVRNFFAQDNLSQDQYQSQAVEGNWPQLGNNQWAGSQRHTGLPNSSSKNYNLQQSDIERGPSSQFSSQQQLNLAQSTLRPDRAKTQPQIPNPSLNGYMHGNRNSQTRQNEANFLGMGTESNSPNMTSRGLSMYESQQGHGSQTHTTTMRSESSDSPVGFDFFGGQQQMSSQQTGMQHPLMLQQSGFGDPRMLQQQAMLRNMQELHRQQQNQQVQARQQNLVHQIPSFSEQASGNHSHALFNGTPVSSISAASNYPWVTDPTAGNTNWMQNPSSAFQEASNGFRSPPEQNQAMSFMGMSPQSTNQSLFGVPVSRAASNQYSNISLNKPSAQQMTPYSNSAPINQRTGFHNQASMQEGSVASKQAFQAENMFGNASGQGSFGGTALDNLQQVNPLPRNAPVHEFHERLQLAGASETSQEKTGMQASSQNAAALDPTEEKILFGDDNIWEAFGSSANMGAGDLPPSNGPDSFGGFPSLQSGSWSALMQSAVAETSSNDTGFQEEWNGLNLQNSEVPAKNRQSSTYEGNVDQSVGLAEKNVQTVATLNSLSVPFSTDANVSNSYLDITGFQQSRQNMLSNQGDIMKTTSTQSSIPQSSEAGSKWLSRGPPQKPFFEERNQGTGAHSLDAQRSGKSISGTWAPQQNVSYNSGQPHNVHGHEDGDSVSATGDSVSKFHGNLSMGSSQMNGEDYRLRHLADMPNNSAAGGSRNASQVHPNNHNLNYWKHADSSPHNKGNESPGMFQHHLNNGPQVLESTVSSSGNGGVNLHDMENSDRKESSCDSHHSNFSQHDTPSGSRENVWLDGNDSRNASKQKSSVQAGRKSAGSRKFQYHPMGNLDGDVEPSTGTKQTAVSQAMFQQASRGPFSHNQGLFEQSKLHGQSVNSSSNFKKGHPPDQGTKKSETSSRGSLPPNAPATFSSPVDTSKDSQSSQNMLELLHKVNQSNEGYSDSFAGHFRQSQPSASQGFGLQLGPPSQGFHVQNRALPSQSSAQIDSSSSRHMSPDTRERNRGWSPSPSQIQSLKPSHGTPQGDLRNNQEHTTIETLPAANQGNFPSRAQNQQVVRLGGKVATNQLMNLSFNRSTPFFPQNDSSGSRAPNGQSPTVDSSSKPVSSEETPRLNDPNDPHGRASAPQTQVGRAFGPSQPSAASQQGAFRKIVGNAWSSVPGQQQFSGAPSHKFHPSAFQPSESEKNTPTSSVHLHREDFDRQKGGEGHLPKDSLHRENPDLAEKMHASPGKESLSMDSEASPSNSASTQRDIEAFGRSLKPTTLSNQKYSLLQQMKAMKSTENDLNTAGAKRLKVGDSSVRTGATPFGDTNMLSFSGPVDNRERNASSQLGNTPFARKDAENLSSSSAASVRVNNSHISPQMAPSWFNQFGSFTKGQMMQMYDARKNATAKTVDQPLKFGTSSDGLQVNPATNLSPAVDNQEKSTPSSVAVEQISSSQTLAQDVTDQPSVALRKKKRKTATSELLHWHKEVTQGSQSLLSISATEASWAKAANRLTEKVQDQANLSLSEDRPPVLRPKRRVILTTQLMQQLFLPPPAALLSGDGTSNCEAVVYHVARLALGNTCSVIPSSESDPSTAVENSNLSPDKHKTSKRVGGQHFSQVMDDFLSRARKLENDFVRSDKRASVLDLRIESQDIERFSVINRFAKFHIRGHSDAAAGETSSDVATTTGQALLLQRYVNALPVPKNLPDRVQCLSL